MEKTTQEVTDKSRESKAPTQEPKEMTLSKSVLSKPRTQKQIEWSKELGKRSREFKQKKRDKEFKLKQVEQEEIPEIPEEEDAPKNPEPARSQPTSSSNYWLIGGVAILFIGGCVYFCKSRQSKPKNVAPVEIKPVKKLNNLLHSME